MLRAYQQIHIPCEYSQNIPCYFSNNFFLIHSEVSVIGMQKTYESYRVVKIFKQAQENNDIALLKLNRQVTGTGNMVYI